MEGYSVPWPRRGTVQCPPLILHEEQGCEVYDGCACLVRSLPDRRLIGACCGLSPPRTSTHHQHDNPPQDGPIGHIIWHPPSSSYWPDISSASSLRRPLSLGTRSYYVAAAWRSAPFSLNRAATERRVLEPGHHLSCPRLSASASSALMIAALVLLVSNPSTPRPRWSCPSSILWTEGDLLAARRPEEVCEMCTCGHASSLCIVDLPLRVPRTSPQPVTAMNGLDPYLEIVLGWQGLGGRSGDTIADNFGDQGGQRSSDLCVELFCVLCQFLFGGPQDPTRTAYCQWTCSTSCT